MSDLYTRGEGRTGEREKQLDVRGRIDDYMAIALQHDGRDWLEWPSGRADITQLKPGSSVELPDGRLEADPESDGE